QAPKQWHQKVDEVVLSSSYLLNQADDMLIFGTNQIQLDLTKEFLSSMDKEFGYQKTGRRLPARHRELPDSAKPHKTSLGSYMS
ncbi:hypothetical protein Tco_0372214, partial [Tanacetum coccineum]